MDILFVTATRIGDAVLSTGILGYLIERYPAARLTIAAGPVAAPLFEAVPRLERLIVISKQRFALHWLGLYRTIVGRRWDLVVDLRGSTLAWLLRAGERRVMAKGDKHENRVRQLARLFDLDSPPSPRLWLTPAHERAAEALIPAGTPVLAIGPASNWRGKQWRAERFAELAGQLTAPRGILAGARVAVMAAAHERGQAEPLLSAIPGERVIDLIGHADLLTASAALRRAALFIGNDTGLMHIAAASGVPTLGLFGPSPIDQYAPWGPLTAVVRTADPPETMFPDGFDHRTTDTLMDSLSVEAVQEAAHLLWQRVADSQSVRNRDPVPIHV
ncbi:MAG TPA: glycosyltransferase family 9 protein [Stellaceae bacterium]|nr:glycosyltransferase family 9 protein [Stellaceae bacterium]